MSKYANKVFWVDTLDRFVATTAQGALGAIGTGAIGILDVDALGVASVALMAGLTSVLTCIALRGGKSSEK